MQHDNSFWVGGTRQDFHLANAEFLSCMLLWGIDPEIAYARWGAVERGGWDSWKLRPNRTRGPRRYDLPPPPEEGDEDPTDE